MNTPQPAAVPQPQDRSQPAEKGLWLKGLYIAFGAVLFIVMILAIAINLKNTKPSSASDSPDESTHTRTTPDSGYVPVEEDQIISREQILVSLGGYVWKTFMVPNSGGIVTGTFSVSGGGGNDIEGVLTDQMNYTNYINHHVAQTYWNTGGKETVGNIQTGRLALGTYYLVWSNMFSLLAQKLVSVDVHISGKLI